MLIGWPPRPQERVLNYEYIKRCFESQNCVLLSPVYENSDFPLEYICSCGNKSKIRFSNFSKGQKCQECNLTRKQKKGKRLDFEFIQEEFRKNNCQLLETEYKNAKQKLRYICSCGNESVICYDSFRSGNRCRKCGNKRSGQKQKGRKGYKGKKWYSTQHVKDTIEGKNYTLLDNKYEGCNQKLKIKCNQCGKLFNKLFNDFKRWKGCTHGVVSRISHDAFTVDAITNNVEIKKSFRYRCYSLLRRTLLAIEKTKNDRTKNILGYTSDELKNHITNHAKWKEISKTEWDIDHIYPIKAFIDYGILDIKLINCLENLQPLPIIENRVKGCVYDKQNFENWLHKKGIL